MRVSIGTRAPTVALSPEVETVPTNLVLGLLLILAVGEFLLFGALAEAYRDITQLRNETGIVDEAQPVDVGVGLGGQPSAYGLHPSLDTAAKGLALFVNRRCGTCQSLVRSLNGGLPRGVTLIVVDDDADAAFSWLEQNGFDMYRTPDLPISAATADDPNPLGIDVTPLAVEIEHGRIVGAFTIPSVRRFYSRVPAPHVLISESHHTEVVV